MRMNPSGAMGMGGKLSAFLCYFHELINTEKTVIPYDQ